MGSTVALVRCENYQSQTVLSAVRKGIDLLGGIDKFTAEGERILIKPNLLTGEHPDKCISPHPEVFRAVVEVFMETGVKLSYGDSPGVGSTKMASQRVGYFDIAKNMHIESADFSTAIEVPFRNGRMIKKFPVAKGALDCDGIINLPKLKTHGLTRITCAVKNMFGCIPGIRKSEYHSVLQTSALFSKMLVDLNRLLKPRLSILDGVMAMEGNGPRNGTPREMGVLIFSEDPIALDTAVCHLINLDPRLVETNVYGQEFGLGKMEDIHFVGDPLGDFIQRDFKVNRNRKKTAPGSSFLSRSFMRRFTAPQPTIREEACTRCGLCVKICPAQPKALSWNGKEENIPPVYDYEKCIRCYCCQEMCPSEAIYIRNTFLGKLIH